MKTIASILLIVVLASPRGYAQVPDSLRIITYNIHHAGPPAAPGTIDIDTFIRIFKKYGADIIALQEVDVNTRRSGNINEARLIAEGLGMFFFFAKAINYDGGDYGVALLSRFPLKDTQVLRLPMDSTVKGEQRVLATASITLSSGRRVTVACTHLDHQKEPKSRQLQIEAIARFSQKSNEPFVLAGDLNAEENAGVIHLFDAFFQRTCSSCPFSFPALVPNRTIDYISYKRTDRIRVLSHQVLPESFASDHLPVKAVIVFN